MHGAYSIGTRLAILIGLAVLLAAAPAAAYTTFHPSNSGGCFQCHGEFQHNMHVGSNDMTNNCLLCHTSVGDNPHLGSSGQGVGCIGCHVGPGLRNHHANAGAPADNGGLFCVDCHDDDPTPAAENVLPPYYSRADVNITDPCVVASADGGEDYSGDGEGLDNDGNLLYEQDDPACNTTSVPGAQAGLLLHPCHPNPFNPSTNIRFELPAAAAVRLGVYSVEGRRIATLVNEPRAAGAHTVIWNGRDDHGMAVPSGTYVCRIQAGQAAAATRMVLIK